MRGKRQQRNISTKSTQIKKSKINSETEIRKNTVDTSYYKNNQKLKIFVKLYTGSTVEMNLKCTDTIGFIKQQIQEQENIPQAYQRLMFVKIELDDDNKICQDYSIKNLITLQCQTKILLVATESKGVLSIPIEISESVQSLKSKIQDQTGIAKNKQRLFYPCCSYRGKQLHDFVIISESNIKGHWLNMVEVENKFGVFVELLESSRRIIYVSLKATDKIEYLKANIFDKISLKVDDYKLLFMDTELENEKTLQDYEISNETTLQLCKEKMIYVQKLSGNKIELNVERSDKIDDVKKKIDNNLGIPYNVQTLYFHGQQLENLKTLADYSIGFGMKLRLKIGIQIFITCSLKPKTILEMQLTDTIIALKERINENLGFPIDNQKIRFNGIDLENEKELIDYGIKEYSNLNLMVHSEKPIQIFIWCDTNKLFLEIDSCDTIKIIKKRCEDQLGRSLKNHNLYYDKISLNENVPFSKYNIDNQSTLYLVDKNSSELLIFFGMSIDEKYKKVPVKINPNARVINLELKFQEIVKKPFDNYRFIFSDEPMQSYLSLLNYDIENGDTIEVYERQMGC